MGKLTGDRSVNEEEARKILEGCILKDNSLYDQYQYLYWTIGETEVVLDGQFGVEELEAIAWWVKKFS